MGGHPGTTKPVRDGNFTKFVGDHWEDAPMLVRPHIHSIQSSVQRTVRPMLRIARSRRSGPERWALRFPLDTHIKDINTPFGAAKYAGKGVTWAKAEGDFNYAAALALALDGVRCSAVGGMLRSKASE